MQLSHSKAQFCDINREITKRSNTLSLPRRDKSHTKTSRVVHTKKMNSSALRALALEYKSLLDEPVEGFRVKLVNDDNLFEWSVSDSS